MVVAIDLICSMQFLSALLIPYILQDITRLVTEKVSASNTGSTMGSLSWFIIFHVAICPPSSAHLSSFCVGDLGKLVLKNLVVTPEILSTSMSSASGFNSSRLYLRLMSSAVTFGNGISFDRV